MRWIAGVDIGNATTETALARLNGNGQVVFQASATCSTTGVKGTEENIKGVFASLKQAADAAGVNVGALSSIRINEAAPVIGDVAMETITETIITESTIIGHNPATPGGIGVGQGISVGIGQLERQDPSTPVVVVVPASTDFEAAAHKINSAVEGGVRVTAAIAERDDAVLINNRLNQKIPIIDEVKYIDRVPLGMPAAVEVAAPGRVVEVLSNPYGIATLFGLTGEETQRVMPIARALIGNRSAVVIKTPEGDVKERRIPAGRIHIHGAKRSKDVDIQEGSVAIMKILKICDPVENITGEAGTNAGGMLERVRHVMANLTEQPMSQIRIQDFLAVDTFVPQKVTGGLAGEFAMENAVGVAAMVKADRLQMDRLAAKIQERLEIEVKVGGVEAEMAVRGALTTPGAEKPLAIIDMGAGSTDASLMDAQGAIRAVHLAGAGNMVTLLIDTELGLGELSLAEDIKKYPLARVESLFHIRHEDGTVEFFETPADPRTFARTVILKEGTMIPLPMDAPVEKVRRIRREAKEKVFVVNALRALEKVCLTGNIRELDHVVLVGGSSLDFEIPQMVTDALSKYGVTSGRGNVRGTEGPRNAVATGLVLAYGGEPHDG